jgi:serine/threonine-protein kinase
MLPCPRCKEPCGEAHKFCFACGAELGGAPQRALDDPLVGRTLPGGYRVTHLVGVGGMGRVYCAEQVALGRTVAVKVVHPHLADEELAVGRFLNEARTASRLSHPNSVAIFDFGRTEQGQPYLVMEYLRGRDLARVAEDEGPLPIRRVVDILRQTLAALEEAHALGIVHRDLKPDNVVLEPLRSGLDFVKVVDFGLAKLLEQVPSAPGAALTRPGLVCGTPEYMSPEQGRGDALDGRADLYSVGVVLFELLAGRVPFAGESATKTLLMHINEPVPDPRKVAPERAIPEVLAELTRRALAKAREERFQTAREMSDGLEKALLATNGRRSQPGPTTGTRCRTCGERSPVGQKFCGHCGASIAASTPARKSPPQSGPQALPLLARADALEWLETRYHQAGAVLAAAHVIGDAGTGKTRLLEEFLARCSARGDRVVSVAPDPAWAKIGDQAVRDAVRALAALPAESVDAEAWSGASAQATLGLEMLFRGAASPAAPAERRAAVAAALRWALERAGAAAGKATVVLAVDDADFIDGTSRNAFADLLGDPPVASALVVVTYAPNTSPVGEALSGESWTLSPLAHSELAHLLPARLATPPRPLVPLHLEQLIAWARTGRDPPPERLAELIARRTERLSPDARHALHAASVWGDGASSEIVSSLLPPGVDAADALAQLERARLVTISPEGVRIAHPLVRRVVFSSIPAGRKRELFARCESLRPNAPLEVRAKQAMHGGSALEALSLLDVLSTTRAAHGDLAGSVSALRHALDVARRELHRDDLDDPMGAMLLFARKLAEALATSQQWTDADGVLREALGNAPPTSAHRARLLGVLARVAHARSQPAEARRYIDEAMRVARTSNQRELLPFLEGVEKSIAAA